MEVAAEFFSIADWVEAGTSVAAPIVNRRHARLDPVRSRLEGFVGDEREKTCRGRVPVGSIACLICFGAAGLLFRRELEAQKCPVPGSSGREATVSQRYGGRLTWKSVFLGEGPASTPIIRKAKGLIWSSTSIRAGPIDFISFLLCRVPRGFLGPGVVVSCLDFFGVALTFVGR